jgi:hypothetical protein
MARICERPSFTKDGYCQQPQVTRVLVCVYKAHSPPPLYPAPAQPSWVEFSELSFCFRAREALMCRVEPIAFSDLCKWLDSMAMHPQRRRCDNANGWHYRRLPACVPHAHGSLAWILGYHFRSLGARAGGCSCLAWPFSAHS